MHIFTYKWVLLQTIAYEYFLQKIIKHWLYNTDMYTFLGTYFLAMRFWRSSPHMLAPFLKNDNCDAHFFLIN